MVDYDEFIGKYYPRANDTQKDDIRRFLDNLQKVAGPLDIEDALQNENKLCKSFFLQQNGNNVSRPHYQKIKDYLVNLGDYYHLDITVPERSTVLFSRDVCYFRSLDDAMNTIDTVGDLVLKGYDPDADLVNVKSITALGWVGLTPAECAEVKKSDLKFDGRNCIVNWNGQKRFISGEAAHALYCLSVLETYRGLPTGKLMRLTGDPDYLFRPTIHSDKLCGDSLIQMLRRFNQQSRNSGVNRTIVARNLRPNAKFLEVYNDKSNATIISKLCHAFGCSQNYALSYKEQYLVFQNAMDKGLI